MKNKYKILKSKNQYKMIKKKEKSKEEIEEFIQKIYRSCRKYPPMKWHTILK